MKKIAFLLFALLISSCAEQSAKTSVAVVSIVEIEPIRQLRVGFLDVLQEREKVEGLEFNIVEYNAQGDDAILGQIVDQIIINKPDMVYVLGTSVSQAIQKRDSDILVVQGAATDPIAAGLANSWEKTGKNYAANSDLPPLNVQLRLIQKLLPDARKIGVIYNPGEVNSVAILDRLNAVNLNDKLGYSIVERPLDRSADAVATVESLIGNVDALYIPPDNTVHSSIRAVINTSNENNIPVFATTSEAVDFGALASIALDFEELGREAGYLTLRILDQTLRAKDSAILLSENPQIVIGKAVAERFNANIDDLNDFNNVVVQ